MPTTTTWLDELGRQLSSVADAFLAEVRAQGVVPLLQPVGGYGRGMVAPFATVGGIVGILLLSGIAVSAIGTAVVALLALWLLLARVFGFTVEMNPFGFAAR